MGISQSVPTDIKYARQFLKKDSTIVMLWRGKWWKIERGGTKENIWGLVELTKEFWGRVLKERKVGDTSQPESFHNFSQ